MDVIRHEKEKEVAEEAALEETSGAEYFSKDLDKKITAKLMRREGIWENTQLREMFGNSYFFPKCFDSAIVGVNPLTQSIIYDYMNLGKYWIIFVEYPSQTYDGIRYGCKRMVEWINELTEEKTEGKVKPTLCLIEFQKGFWKDIHQGS